MDSPDALPSENNVNIKNESFGTELFTLWIPGQGEEMR
jgi:hypothetical protein